DNSAKRRRNLIENIALTILNQRLATVAQSDNAPFASAGGSRGNTARSAKIASFRVSYAGDKWQRALEEAEKLRREVVAQGVTQPEIDREVKSITASADASLASSATRLSRNLAGGLINSVERESVFSSPATDVALLKKNLEDITVDEVNAALR